MVIKEEDPSPRRSNFFAANASPPKRAWAAYQRWWVAKHSKALRRTDFQELLLDVRVVTPKAIEEIRENELDFILNFGSGDPPPGIFRKARLGVWTFRHGDVQASGGPACFWNVYQRKDVTGAALVQVSNPREPGTVLREGFFATHPWSYVRNQDTVCFGSADWVVQACKRLSLGTQLLPGLRSEGSLLSDSRVPSVVHILTSALRSTWRRVALHTRGILLSDRWNVGIVDAPINEFLNGTRKAIRWFPPLEGPFFLADPFGVRRDGKLMILAEEFDHRTRKGRVVVTDPGGAGKSRVQRPVLDAPFHVSYPFLIEHEDELYCVPETADAERVDLYRANNQEWKRVATLIQGVAVYDSTVFRHDGLWWLLCRMERPGSDDLCAWYSRDLLGPWSPHSWNPLKTDIRSSRPAGTPFVHRGHLYRPAQDGSRSYGGSIIINRVLRLSPREFEEEAVATVEPEANGPYRHGVHTLAAVGDQTLIDGKRRALVWPAVSYELGVRLRALVGRPSA